MVSTGRWIFLVVGMLFTGSINTLTKKFQMESCGKSMLGHTSVDAAGKPNCPEGEEKFSKPWSQNILMFIGEASVLTTLLCPGRSSRQRSITQQTSAGGTQRAPFYIFAIPAACDVLGTGIGGLGMLFVSAAVWQMTRGSIVIFTSIFSVVFLKAKKYAYHWIAVGVTVCGVTLVGTAAMLDEGASGSGSTVLMGIALTIVGQAFSAFQAVTEELFIKGYAASPTRVVGSEGIWGILFMIVLLAFFYLVPGDDNGSYESFPDTMYKITKSPMPLDLWGFIYLVSIGMYNLFGTTMTGQLSAVHRCLVDALRTAVVWSVELSVFYSLRSSSCSPHGQENGECFGVEWGVHSYLQLIGFTVLLFGTLMYNAIIKLPGLYYPPPGEAQKPMAPAIGFASPVAQLFSPVTQFFSPSASPSASPAAVALLEDGPDGVLHLDVQPEGNSKPWK